MSWRRSSSWTSLCTYGLAAETAVTPPALAALALDFAILTSLGSLAAVDGNIPPTHMFERFSEPARQVVVVASEEARALRHPSIGAVHLLLGVLAADPFVSPRLAGLAITPGVVRAGLAPGAEDVSGQMPFEPVAKRVLERALREAMNRREHEITPAHLALALTREAALIDSLDAEPLAVRRAIRDEQVPAPLAARSFPEELALALRRAEEIARADGRPMDAADLLLGLRGAPVAGYVLRAHELEAAVTRARTLYDRLHRLRAEMRTALADGQVARAEELRAEARRLRDELEGR